MAGDPALPIHQGLSGGTSNYRKELIQRVVSVDREGLSRKIVQGTLRSSDYVPKINAQLADPTSVSNWSRLIDIFRLGSRSSRLRLPHPHLHRY